MTRCSQSDRFRSFWGASFGTNFLYVSQLPDNSYFATIIMRKHFLFYHFRLPMLASKNQSKNNICCRPVSWTSLFSFLYFSKNDRFWDPPQNLVGAKMGPKILSNQCMTFSSPGGFVSRPAFTETIVITVPFGPSGF